MTNLPDIAIGAIIAAVITAIVSLLSLIISKEMKISEFRQKWTDDLRSEISSLLSHAVFIYSRYDAREEGESDDDIFKSLKDEYLKINLAATQIKLRLNPEEPHNKKILAAIEESELLLSTPAEEYTPLDTFEKTLVTASQECLKSEWRRIKKGESAYRTTRIILIIFLAIGLSALIFSVLRGAHVF